LIYNITTIPDELIYIGSSGRKDLGGIYDRLVNGYHPNRFEQEGRIKRRYAFPRNSPYLLAI